jgi:hypothetical protein
MADEARCKQRAIEPPHAEQRVAGRPGEHGGGEVGGQQVLRALSGSRGTAEPGSDPPFGFPERWLKNGGARGEHEPGDLLSALQRAFECSYPMFYGG